MSTEAERDSADPYAVEEAVRYIREHLDSGTAEIRRWSIGVLMADYDRRGAQRSAVLALHTPEPITLHGGQVVPMCEHCNTGDPYCTVSMDWPCPTVRALGGGS